MTQTAMDGSKALPEEQWKKYQLMTGESRERLECRGVLLRCLDEAAREEKHQAEEMKRDIVDLVDMYRMDNDHFGELLFPRALILTRPTEVVLEACALVWVALMLLMLWPTFPGS
ncbi:uncharacterized protein LOC126991092 isoform X1 [Eriocheir sinensis]|uniref:uncharacterized protein LOC126991092 isoform X1 n=1 Tax=Eriocheir sinensis TaxID=95602 RepID=UPI0021C793FE|nr:uncharacterized protein LOC126991092 isoform X1 [Eriocheir sinensis]